MQSKWRLTRLADAGIALIDCDHRTPPAAESGYPYVAIPQLKGGHIDLSGVRRITKEHFDEWTRKLRPREHDVVVVRRCNSGISAVVPKELNCAIGQNLVVLRSDGKCVRPEYLRWLVRGDEWWEQVRKHLNVGAIFDSLRCRDIPNFEVLIPDVNEQASICEILNALDSHIVLLGQINTTLESIAQAIFTSWFVDFDPVRAKTEGGEPVGMDAGTAALFPDDFEESELGFIPKGWRVLSVGDLCSQIVNGGTPSRSAPKYWEGGHVPWFKTGELFDGFLLQSSERITEAAVSNTSVKLLPRHAVLMAIYAAPTVGRLGILTESAAFNQACTGMVAREEIGAWFLFQVLKQGRVWFNGRANGAAQQNISKAIVEGYKCVVPSPQLLGKYTETVESLFESIETNCEMIRTLEDLLDALLPRLISGKLRIPEAKEALEEVLT